jgi:hypothetical protein
MKKLLATASDPKSQAALQNYMAKGNVGLKTPINSGATTEPSVRRQDKAGLTTPATKAPSVLNSPSILGAGAAGSISTTGNKAKLPASGPTTLGR